MALRCGEFVWTSKLLNNKTINSNYNSLLSTAKREWNKLVNSL